METGDIVTTLAALGQATRLETFRLIVRAGDEGLRPSDISAQLNVPRNTMSSHLGILAAAGLVDAERMSRQIFYRAQMSRLRDVTAFLAAQCADEAADAGEVAKAREPASL